MPVVLIVKFLPLLSSSVAVIVITFVTILVWRFLITVLGLCTSEPRRASGGLGYAYMVY